MLILITMTSNAEHLSPNVFSSPRAVLPRQAANAECAMTAACQRTIV
jgi:hypothetical protein